MKIMIRIALLMWLSNYVLCNSAFAQNSTKVNWISFNQLNDSLKVKPKKVFVNFYASWCIICKQMEHSAFADKDVIKELNEGYYAVKMDIESADTINFGGQTFVNNRIKKVNPIHEIALLMASRKNKPFSVPAFVLLDDEFAAKARYFQYMDAHAMKKILTSAFQ